MTLPQFIHHHDDGGYDAHGHDRGHENGRGGRDHALREQFQMQKLELTLIKVSPLIYLHVDI